MGDALSVTLVTEVPKVSGLVISGVPVLPPPMVANGEMVTVLAEDPGVLVPVAVIVTVAPAGMDDPRVKLTTLVVAGGTSAAVTVTGVAVPPDGVKVTE